MIARAAAGCVEPIAAPRTATNAGTLPALRTLVGIRGFVERCAGNGLALSGVRLQSIVIAWLVLEMTGSRMWLGVVVGLPALAVIGASLAGGVLADSQHARATLRTTRLAMAGAAFVAGLLVSTGQVEIGFLMMVALVAAFATAVDMPVNRTLIFDLVGRDRLLSGTAMSSMAQNLCAVFGPLAVGVLMSRAGIDAALYALAAAYAVSSLLIPPVERQSPPRDISPWQELKAGIAYLSATPCVAWLVGLLFLVPLAGVFFAMVPVYAREVLDVGPAGLGAIMAAYGAGTVLGSGYLVINGQMRNRGQRVTVVGVLFGLGVIAFAVSDSILVSGLISFAIGVTAMLWLNSVSAMVQTAAAPEMRGRAMSVGTMGIQLMSAGWLVAGPVSTLAGPLATVVLAGAAFAALSLLVYARSADVRAID